MTYSQKYTIVQFLAPIQDSQVFAMKDWPLHITLADVFAIKLDQPLLDQLATFLAAKKSFSVTAKGEGRLGGKNEDSIKVTLIKNTPELQLLHDGLIDLLETNGAVFNSPQFTHQGFLPHATHQSHAQLSTGQRAVIDKLSLVDMFVDGNWQQRKVLETIKLKT